MDTDPRMVNIRHGHSVEHTHPRAVFYQQMASTQHIWQLVDMLLTQLLESECLYVVRGERVSMDMLKPMNMRARVLKRYRSRSRMRHLNQTLTTVHRGTLEWRDTDRLPLLPEFERDVTRNMDNRIKKLEHEFKTQAFHHGPNALEFVPLSTHAFEILIDKALNRILLVFAKTAPQEHNVIAMIPTDEPADVGSGARRCKTYLGSLHRPTDLTGSPYMPRASLAHMTRDPLRRGTSSFPMQDDVCVYELGIAQLLTVALHSMSRYGTISRYTSMPFPGEAQRNDLLFDWGMWFSPSYELQIPVDDRHAALHWFGVAAVDVLYLYTHTRTTPMHFVDPETGFPEDEPITYEKYIHTRALKLALESVLCPPSLDVYMRGTHAALEPGVQWTRFLFSAFHARVMHVIARAWPWWFEFVTLAARVDSATDQVVDSVMDDPTNEILVDEANTMINESISAMGNVPVAAYYLPFLTVRHAMNTYMCEHMGMEEWRKWTLVRGDGPMIVRPRAYYEEDWEYLGVGCDQRYAIMVWCSMMHHQNIQHFMGMFMLDAESTQASTPPPCNYAHYRQAISSQIRMQLHDADLVAMGALPSPGPVDQRRYMYPLLKACSLHSTAQLVMAQRLPDGGGGHGESLVVYDTWYYAGLMNYSEYRVDESVREFMQTADFRALRLEFFDWSIAISSAFDANGFKTLAMGATEHISSATAAELLRSATPFWDSFDEAFKILYVLMTHPVRELAQIARACAVNMWRVPSAQEQTNITEPNVALLACARYHMLHMLTEEQRGTQQLAVFTSAGDSMSIPRTDPEYAQTRQLARCYRDVLRMAQDDAHLLIHVLQTRLQLATIRNITLRSMLMASAVQPHERELHSDPVVRVMFNFVSTSFMDYVVLGALDVMRDTNMRITNTDINRMLFTLREGLNQGPTRAAIATDEPLAVPEIPHILPAWPSFLSGEALSASGITPPLRPSIAQ